MDISKYSSIRKLRSEDGRFPIESELNPIIFIWVEDGIQVAYCKSGSATAIEEMGEMIKELQSKEIEYRIIGTWAGKYSTDTFKFEGEDFLNRLCQKKDELNK